MIEYPNTLKSKLPNVGTTIFTVMSKLAAEQNAINLSQGFPDFESSPELIELVSKYMRDGFNQYAPMQGILPLREVLSKKIESLYGTAYDPESEITITAGATQAIYTAISALVHDGDEVIMFTPAYDCYGPAIELNGGKPVYIQLNPEDYSVNWKQVRNMISRKTKMIIINTPHNPTGAVLDEKDIKELDSIVKDSEIIVLSDEVYEHIIYDGKPHESVAKYPTLAARSIAVYSFGKTFHNTGWKLGYCVAPAAIMSEFRKVHQYNVFCCNTPIQFALAEYLKEPDNYLGLGAFYQKKRDLFLSMIEGARLKPLACEGTYFSVLSYAEITDQIDTEYAIKLTKENRIASVPLSVFYNIPVKANNLRFCFAKKEETLEAAAKIIRSI